MRGFPQFHQLRENPAARIFVDYRVYLYCRCTPSSVSKAAVIAVWKPWNPSSFKFQRYTGVNEIKAFPLLWKNTLSRSCFCSAMSVLPDVDMSYSYEQEEKHNWNQFAPVFIFGIESHKAWKWPQENRIFILMRDLFCRRGTRCHHVHKGHT